jgi:Uma2 family endonuclease
MIEERRRRGMDRYDEVWEGIYHMSPPPTYEHQSIVDGLLVLLKPYAEAHAIGTLSTGLGVAMGREPSSDYRVPNLLFAAEGRRSMLKEGSSWVLEGPDAVIEFRSPDDELYDKLSFYAAAGVREVFIVDRQTRRFEMFRLAGRAFGGASPDAEGWLRSEAMACAFRSEAGRLRVRLGRTGQTRSI